MRLQKLLVATVQRWSQLAMSRAFQQWKDWALHQASLHRRMRAVMSKLMGRTLHWAFCMMRCATLLSWGRLVRNRRLVLPPVLSLQAG